MADSKEIGQRLSAAHKAHIGAASERARGIRLPSETQIRFERSGPDIHIHMTPSAVTANMQENSAAFEGWSLALQLWLKTRCIHLHWLAPERSVDQPLNRHYARFLYRVQRFASLFPDWFLIASPELVEECPTLAGHDLFLNVSGPKSKEPASYDGRRETLIERHLAGEDRAVLQKALGLDAVGRQFPVGLYRTSGLKGPVFTGGTSAIDLVGTSSKGEFAVIELKAKGNIMVGALGELLFYASVMRDAAGPGARFQFGGKVDGKSHSEVRAQHVRSAKAIRAILMAEDFHPLLEHPDLFPTLNAAASAQTHPVPLSFEMWLLSDFEEGLTPRLEPVALAA